MDQAVSQSPGAMGMVVRLRAFASTVATSLVPEDARTLCHEAIRLVMSEVGVSCAMLYQLVNLEGTLYYGHVETFADAATTRQMQTLAGRRMYDAPGLDVLYPRDSDVEQFTFQNFWRHNRNSEIYRCFYVHLGVHSVARILLYDGLQFVGWLGFMRRNEEPAFGPRDSHVFSTIREPLIEGVSATLRHAWWPTDDAATLFAIYSPAGERMYASEAFAAWCTSGRQARLNRAIARHAAAQAAGAEDGTPLVIDGYEVRFARLQGASGPGYLVECRSASPVIIPPDAVLTPIQRTVADFAASGATVDEIARAMNRSAHTIRTHLKNIYVRLGVSTRLELAEILAQDRLQR